MAGETVTLDITTVTLGEAAAAEIASGMTLQTMIKSRAALLLLGLFIHELRSSGQPPSWNDLSSRRLLDVSSWMPQSDSTETPAK